MLFLFSISYRYLLPKINTPNQQPFEPIVPEVYGIDWNLQWLKFCTNWVLVFLQGPVFYLALFHGNLYLVYAEDLSMFVPIVSQDETLNDGAYHTVRIEFGAVG